jgi:2-polyprenyl-3-methyl-5-hydroxy-6-metoxy-1,4-benzoquinol methylase
VDDFRAALFERYVSTFKAETGAGSQPRGIGTQPNRGVAQPGGIGARPSGPGAQPSGVGAQPSYAWWDHKYLPLLGGLDRSMPILEIGCGSGHLLAYLGRRGFSNARGIDISAEQVELARGRGVRVEHADAFEFFERRAQPRWGAILAVDVLEHMNRDELIRMAPLLFAALQPGGRLLIQTINGAGLFPRQVIYGDLTHMTVLTPGSLAQLLRPAGFVDLEFHETGPIPLRVRGKLDVALWGAIKRIANIIRRIETGKRQSIWTENFICVAYRRAS